MTILLKHATARLERLKSAARNIPDRTFWRGMLVLGLLSACLHGAHLGYILHCSDRDGVDYYVFPDTRSYRDDSVAMFDERPMSPLFRERIVYPLLLAAAHQLDLPARALLWLPVPMEIPAVLAMALMGLLVSRRKSVAALAAVIYVVNPNSYQISAALMPDWLNAQFALISFALVMNWVLKEDRKSGIAACVMIPITQMIRPTLFPMIVPLLLLLGTSWRGKERRLINGLLCLSALMYPLVNTAINYHLYGVPRPLLAPGLQLHHGYVSMMRAMERNAENPGSLSDLYFDEKHNVALMHPAEIAVAAYWNTPIRQDFASNYHHIVQYSKEFVAARPLMRLTLHRMGAERYFFMYPSFSPGIKADHLYPDWSSVMRKIHWLALFFTLCGAAWMIGRLNVNVTLFILCWTGVVGLILIGTWHDSVRVRVIIDLLATPFLATGLLSLPAWMGFAALVMAAYVPRRFMGASHYFMLASAALVSAVTAVVLAVYSINCKKK
jgi:hypothetical protein